MSPSLFRLTGLCLLGLLAAGTVPAQQIGGSPTDAKLSPNGGADGTNMSSIYSPNLYDGSTNVQVPIFSYQGPDGGSYGVSFSYNTKGIKADQIASQAGLGWSLSAGGSIQRIIKDIPDELYIHQFYDTLVEYYEGYIDFNKMRGRFNASFETPAEAAETNVYRDKESDDFIVSLGSLSFTFNIGKTGSIFTHPNRRVRVEFLIGGVPITSTNYPLFDNPNLEFRLTDEQGVVYYFKKGDMEDRILGSAYSAGSTRRITNYRSINRWVIHSITFPNGSVISYTYNATNGGSYTDKTNFSASELSANTPAIYTPPTTSLDYVYPATIQYPNNTTVSFEYDQATYRCDGGGVPPLKKIRVSSGTNCSVYKLDQAYFVAAFPGNSAGITELAYNAACNTLTYAPPAGETYVHSDLLYRLKLKSIRLWDCSETESEPFYSFQYDPTPLGVRGRSQDWFGYYNGKTPTWEANTPNIARPSSFSSLASIPLHKIQGYNDVKYGLDKTEDITYMKAGILTAVNNAYGGTVRFHYSGHSNLSNTPITNLFPSLPTEAEGFLGMMANDGLRLDSIVEQERIRPDDYKVTTFTYEQGQRFMPGGYFRSWEKMTGASGTTATTETWQSNYVSPHHLVNGSNHGYGKVTITNRNQAGTLLSRREMTFTNLTNEITGEARYLILGGTAHYFQFPFTDKQYLRDWEMGLPLTVTEYDNNNRITQKVTNTYDYSRLDITSSQTRQVLNERRALVDYVDAPFVATLWGPNNLNVRALRTFSDTYRPYTGAALLQRSVVQRYISDAAFVTDVTDYSYDSYNNLVTIGNQASDGSTLLTNTIYNYAVQSPLGSTLSNMKAAGLEKVVGTERWKQSGGTKVLLDASINTFTLQSGKLLPKAQYLMAISQPLTECQYTGNCGGSPVTPSYSNIDAAFGGSAITYFRKTAEVLLSDVQGNPLESTIPEANAYKAMIWDNLSGQKLAEAVNCRYNEIGYAGFEGGGANGRFSYTPGQVVNAAGLGSQVRAPGGRKAYGLVQTSTGSVDMIISGLTAGKTYVLTFWAMGSPVFRLAGGATVPLQAGAAVAGFVPYTTSFTVASTGDTYGFASGAGAMSTLYLDDVRLHPETAQMQHWSYEPLFGVSSATDARGRTIRYEYDALGRQSVVRDHEGNVLSKTVQQVQ